MKVRKILLSVILIACAILLILNNKTYATTYPENAPWVLDAVKLRRGRNLVGNSDQARIEQGTSYSYQLNRKPTLKIVAGNNDNGGTVDYNDMIYCMKAGAGFGSEDENSRNPIAHVAYQNAYEYFNNLDSIKRLQGWDNDAEGTMKYGAVAWLLDNMYLLPKDSATEAELKESKKQRDELLKNAVNYYNSDLKDAFDPEEYEFSDVILTDDDIDVVQQWAIWYFTNNDSTFHKEDLPTIMISENPDSVNHEQPNDDGEWLNRQIQADFLFKYLKHEAQSAGSTYAMSVQNRQQTVISFDETSKNLEFEKNVTELGTSYVVVGPFKLKRVGNTNYQLTGTVLDQANNNLNYEICDRDGRVAGRDVTLKTKAEDETEFYLKVNQENLANRNGKITNVKFIIEYTTELREATEWYNEDLTRDQPVVVVKPQKYSGQEEKTVHIPEFDLALRKYIVSYLSNGEEHVLSSESRTRIPNIDETPLKDNLDSTTTANYKHRKDPVAVETGDFVKYSITVYNEGDIAGKATEIVDYLPLGLVLDKAKTDSITQEYNIVADANNSRRIIITPKNVDSQKVLQAYNGETLDSDTVELWCEVTKVAKDGTAEILTNIAQITRAENDKNIEDRDSRPNNANIPSNEEELSRYRGNDSYETLSNPDHYYEGFEDDDDFEKLIVTTPVFDLALRKYIVKVNNENQTISEIKGRIPTIDRNPLDDGEETANYKHRKDPVPVKTGDIVEYVISVYNEGNIDGKATEIIDYLPLGLEFESGLSDNYNINVDENNSRRIIITPKNPSTQKMLKAYNGANLDSDDVRLTCKVTKKIQYGSEPEVLTNIAQITKAVDVHGKQIVNEGDDRDSIPNNAYIPSNEEELSSYQGKDNISELNHSDYYYKGYEDDDDFEKLIVTTPAFDLALRKFITSVDGEELEGSESREPIPDVSPLLEGETTAIYNHPKDPVVVCAVSKIVYTIRIYNEGELDGTATLIEDRLPKELEFIPSSESEINEEYRWETRGDNIIVTDYLGYHNKIINAFDSESETLSFEDVKIECKVRDNAEAGRKLTNIAQINADYNEFNIADRDSQPASLTPREDNDLPEYKYGIDHQDDDDYEKVIIYKPAFDLALRKFITHVEGEVVEPSREPVPNTESLRLGKSMTAEYVHPKNPVIVKAGDKVVYTIRIYNEGDQAGTATLIEDDLPKELEFIDPSESEINSEYRWSVTGNGRRVTTDYLEYKNLIIDAYNPKQDILDFEDVKIECKVKEDAEPGRKITNIAQIGEDDNDDRDSTPSNLVPPANDNQWPEYDNHEEDDDDFEKVIIYKPRYDLALRKFIVSVNDKEPEISREPEVDVTPLIDDDETTTTAIYNHPKNPVMVKNGDVVVYTIRIYNEGEFDAYAEEIKDNIPEGLEYIIDNPVNIEYRWRLSNDQKQISTDYLSKARDEDNVIKAFVPGVLDGNKGLDYKDVKIAFKVIEPNTSTRIITNIAEIKKDDGDDIDSTPDNDEPDEDDIDIEPIKLRYFDLALRKYITKVESKSGQNLSIETDTTKDVSREPQVEIGEDGKIKYIHPKDPVIVANSDVVIYTLRVYNEGTVDGYAEEIKDDVPKGLELVPDHKINVQYGWVMYDEDGNITDKPEEAKTIRTTYLSQENGEDNIIEAFNREEMDTPAYKEVKVAFKVVEKNVNTDRIIINTAEISKDSDDDIDSTPDNDEPDEDDIDKEYVKVKYFDLALAKWVSKAILTEKGNTTVIETGYDATSPKIPVKLELKPNQIDSIILKYEYGIQITNEGQIPGYATEISDYIPEGLEFIPEDNPLWTLESDGKIVTRQLEDKLLQPGESTIITVIFKWKNSKDNFGEKVNWAEISEDKNDKDAKDIDSTPDNLIPEEDDIDYAPVILIPKTGQFVVFVILPTIILAILSTGIVLIKKYVI